eukprot:4064232-Amphidinium_carterae.1
MMIDHQLLRSTTSLVDQGRQVYRLLASFQVRCTDKDFGDLATFLDVKAIVARSTGTSFCLEHRHSY